MIDSHLQTRKLPNQQQQQNALRKLFVVALEDVNDLATMLSYKTIVVLQTIVVRQIFDEIY